MTERSTVYYIPLQNNYTKSRSLFSLECTLNHRIFHLLDSFRKDDVVGIKINSSDQQFNNIIDSKYISLISRLLNEKEASAIICDTSWRFKNKTMNAARHMDQIFKKGMSFSETQTPFMMLDGADGKDELIFPQNKKLSRQSIHLAGGIDNISGLIITSVTTPDSLLGFKGSLYNLGFGLAATQGKIKQHSMGLPKINSERCYYCRKCVHQCPASAIFVQNRKVKIDPYRCINCGKCVDIAEYGGISYEWNTTAQHFQREISKYTNEIMKQFKQSMLFLNFIPDIVKKEYSAILISKDPISIDIASQSLFKQSDDCLKQGHNFFEQASRYDIGNLNYDLISVNY